MDHSFKTFRVLAHRIFGNEAAPNTLESVLKASSSRIHGIETDVFLTKDRSLCILHGDSEYGACMLRDMRSEEKTWKSHVIGECTDEFLKNMCYHKSEGHHILTLPELLPHFKGTGKLINMELKELDPIISQLVVDEFAKHDMLPQLFISSFNHYHRKLLTDYTKKIGIPDVPFGFLTYSLFHASSDEFYQTAKPGDRVVLSYASLRRYPSQYPELYRKIVERGMELSIWFDGIKTQDIETLENYKFLTDIGISGIISNCPTKAMEIHRELCNEQSSQDIGPLAAKQETEGKVALQL